MPNDGQGRREPGSIVPPEWRKRSGAAPAQEERTRVPQTLEEITERWSALMDKRGHGALTPDEEQEARDLEAQMQRMRRQGGMDQAA